VPLSLPGTGRLRLLVETPYFPRPHNIKFLRSLAEDTDSRLIAAWPRAMRSDQCRFEQLRRAFVEARYSASYDICPRISKRRPAIGTCGPSFRRCTERLETLGHASDK